MKVIENIIVLVLDLMLIAVLLIGGCLFAHSYMDAYSYKNLTKAEAATMYLIDNRHYNDLLENYEFIMSIPLVRDTL